MSIRMRVALVFALTLAIAFALGGWLFISQISAAMLKSTDAALALRLSQAGHYLEDDSNLRTPVVTGTPVPGEFVVQIVSPSGQVRHASANAGTRPLLSAAELRQARQGELLVTRLLNGEPERVLAGPIGEGRASVAIAGVSLEPSNSTLRQITDGILIGGAVFVIVGGIGAYWLTRAALGPVERLRREVAALSERDTETTVCVPRTGDEIAALAGTMNDLLVRLRRALARQRAFVADASHELRTPFAVLQGELELAGRPGRNREELRAAVASAAQEAGRLTRITDDLLLLARGDEDRLSLRPELTGISALLATSAERAATRARAADVTCRIDAVPGLTAVVDAGRIRQAVDNLLGNALQFAPPGTPVTLAAEIDGESLVIEVRDSGPGFPPEFLPHAFERFRRPDQDRARSAGGAGLGLAIAQAIVLAHGGKAVASNRPEGGAKVRLELPVSPRSLSEATRPGA